MINIDAGIDWDGLGSYLATGGEGLIGGVAGAGIGVVLPTL